MQEIQVAQDINFLCLLCIQEGHRYYTAPFSNILDQSFFFSIEVMVRTSPYNPRQGSMGMKVAIMAPLFKLSRAQESGTSNAAVEL